MKRRSLLYEKAKRAFIPHERIHPESRLDQSPAKWCSSRRKPHRCGEPFAVEHPSEDGLTTESPRKELIVLRFERLGVLPEAKYRIYVSLGLPTVSQERQPQVASNALGVMPRLCKPTKAPSRDGPTTGPLLTIQQMSPPWHFACIAFSVVSEESLTNRIAATCPLPREEQVDR